MLWYGEVGGLNTGRSCTGAATSRKDAANVKTWFALCPEYLKCQRGQGLVEYALSLIFVAMALILAVTVYGRGVIGIYNSILTSLPAGF